MGWSWGDFGNSIKEAASNFADDVSMGLGITEKDDAYKERTAATIKANSGDDNDKPVVHSVVNGDTISRLALDNKTTIGQIKLDNPGLDINNIGINDSIKITSGTLKPGESIYKGATQDELDAGNKMIEAAKIDDGVDLSEIDGGGGTDFSLVPAGKEIDPETGFEVRELSSGTHAGTKYLVDANGVWQANLPKVTAVSGYTPEETPS